MKHLHPESRRLQYLFSFRGAKRRTENHDIITILTIKEADRRTLIEGRFAPCRPAFLPLQFERFPSSGFYFGMSHLVVLLLPSWLGGKRRLRVREESIVTFDGFACRLVLR